MLKFFKSPLVRISFGLVMVTTCILLLSDLLGMVPDTRKSVFESRKIIAESLSVQLSSVIADGKLRSVEQTLHSVVKRNASVLSAGLRRNMGGLLVDFGDHAGSWTLQPDERSTTTQVQVPLFDQQGRWGTVELRFAETAENNGWIALNNSFLMVIALVSVLGFIGYLLFLKRTMRELDPSAVIPERVRQALDTLAEGLLIVDQDGLIVFSNKAFARKTGLTTVDLIGRQSASLHWEMTDKTPDCDGLPWFCVLEGGALTGNATIKLVTGLKQAYTFAINASPITSAEGRTRGALITFDDITEIEVKNEELRRTLGKLEQIQREITRQNQELHVLATRDPLTGVLNRRSLFQGFDALFLEAQREMEELACIMVDIDHFKLVNDRFGHAMGDKVIKLLAKVLTDLSRPNDLVGRFGGEEFCIALPGVSCDVASGIAERMRLAIQEGHGAKFANAMRITSSFGVSDLTGSATNVAELVDQADKALYVAKESGRNRVVSWSSDLAGEVPESASEESTANQDPVPDEQQEPARQEMAPSPPRQPPPANDEREARPGVVVVPQVLNAKPGNTMSGQPNHHGVDLELWAASAQSANIPLFDRIDQSVRRSNRYQTHLAVVVIDVDALQRVNETLGFSAGEKFARVVISRLKGVLRSTDTVSLTEEDELLFSISRLGANEIVVLLTDLKQTDMVTIVIGRLFAATSSPIEVEGTEFYLDADVGVSLYPLDGKDADGLLWKASSALREAKKRVGRDNYQFYSDETHRRSKHRIRLEGDLHRALDRGEFTVFYQPKVDLKTGDIVGVEALLRWQHPGLGILPPNEFIPIAEHCGLIERISQRVVRTACQQILTWRNAGYGTITVAVNLSPVEFRNPELAVQIISLLEETGISTSALEIEITETVVMQNLDTAAGILTQLNDAGLRVSVDDFGTGYSSLSYLKKFPLSKVKIDRSFISDCVQGHNDAALVSAIIAMGHSLGLMVVAEGVETEEQLRFLQDLNCDEIQGYLISKPLPAGELSELLSHSVEVKRMIMDYGGALTQSTAREGTTGVFGILNEFPAVATEPVEVRRSAGE